MAQWRIRVIIPDGPGAHQAVQATLAMVPATRVFPEADREPAPAAGDVVVDLADEASLGDLLRMLHEISPQVFVSRVPSDEPSAVPKVRVRKLRRVARVAG
jgi:hypothetical protein